MIDRSVFLGLLAAWVSIPLAAQSGPDNDPAQAPGYADNYFHHTSHDSINQFNGQLTVPIAIGPEYHVGPKLAFQATLVYTARVTEPGHPTAEGNPNYFPIVGDPALGVGWSFTPGRIACDALAASAAPPARPCWVQSDGAQVDFFPTSPGSATWRTRDASQYRLTRIGSGSGASYTLADGDGNLSEFTRAVLGYDDKAGVAPGYARDFGRGRDGYYLTAQRDAYGNRLAVTYAPDGTTPCPFVCAMPTSMRCAGSSARSWIPATFTIQRVGEPAERVTNVLTSPGGRIETIQAKTFAGGAAQFSSWTLRYATLPLTARSSSLYCSPTPLTTLVGVSEPPGSNTPNYAFDYFAGGFAQGLLKTFTLPTGATIFYDYGNYHFYRGRRALLSENDPCSLQPPPVGQRVRRSAVYTDSGARGNVAGADSPLARPEAPCLPGQDSRQSEQTHVGVLRRTVSGPDITTAVTDYTQYSFPFGETGKTGAQTLTVALLPADADGRRRAESTLFWAGNAVVEPGEPSTPGDRVGADLRHSVFDADPNPPLLAAGTAPVCGGSYASLCAARSVRTVQRVFEYGGGAVEDGSDRRVRSETTYYGGVTDEDATAGDLCPACVQHRVASSLSPGTSWEGNGRHYGVEQHSGSLGNDARIVTTTWTPDFAANRLNLHSRRSEVDPSIPPPASPTDVRNAVERFFYFEPGTGFPNSALIRDPPTGRVLEDCRYRDAAGNVSDEVTSTAIQMGSLAADPCPARGRSDPLSNFPSNSIGVDGDAFARRTLYAGGEVASRRWVRQTAPLAWHSYRAERDPATGWIVRSFDPAGLVTSFRFDALRRVTSIAPPGEAPTLIAYDSAVQTTVTRTGADDATWERLLYDALGRLRREIRQTPSGYSVRLRSYDPAGHAFFLSEWKACASPGSDCAIASPAGTTSSSFDPFGRTERIVRADGSVTTFSFMDNGTPHSDTRSAVTVGNLGCAWNGSACVGGSPATTAFRRDAFGRVRVVLEPGQDLTTYSYDVAGRLVGVVQGEQTRTFRYDAFGFLLLETTPEGGTVDYRTTAGGVAHSNFGSLGNLLGKKEGAGTVTRSYRYDAAGRVTCEVAGPFAPAEGCDSPGVRLYSRSFYDGDGGGGGVFPAGKLTQRNAYNLMPSPPFSVREEFAFSDAAGRVSEKATSIRDGSGSPVAAVTESWGYDSLGLVVRRGHPRASGTFAVTSTRRDGLITSVTGPGGQPVVTAAVYGPAGELRAWTAGNHVTTTLEPDPSGRSRPARIFTTNAVATAAGGNFDTGPYHYDGGSNLVAAGGDVFRYDSRSRLTSASLVGLGTQTLGYDRYGNPLWNGAATFCLSTCANNRLGTPYTYDLRGNLTANGTAETLEYDELGRQVHEKTPGVDWRYLYTGAGERVAKLPKGGAATYTFRDEASRITTEFPGASVGRDNVFLGNVLVASYVSSPLAGAPGWQWYHSDHLGTPRLVTDPGGRVVESRRYWPYGNGASVNVGTLQRLRFCAMERDSENSRYYDHARMYDASLDRFASPDAARGKPEKPQSWNRYAYAAGNPLGYVDPDGRQAITAGEMAFERDARDLLEGRIGADEFRERTYSRGAAGALGALVLAGGALAPAAAALAGNLGAEAGEAIVLGETMRRVQAVAGRINGQTFATARAHVSEMMAKNISWLQSHLDRGARILDIDLDPSRAGGRSPFYAAEIGLLLRNGYTRVFEKVVMIDGELFRLYRWLKK